MKKALLLVLLLAPTWSAHSKTQEPPPGHGTWVNPTSGNCGIGRVCVEWYEPEGAENGTFCCVSEEKVSANSFDDCLYQVREPRGGEGASSSDRFSRLAPSASREAH